MGFSKHAVKSETSLTGFICSITVSCKQHSGQLNLKFQFEIFFSCVQSSGHRVENNHFVPLFHPAPLPSKYMPQRHCVPQGEVKGHRHREHILILMGKLGRVEAWVPDSKKYTLKCKLKTKNYCSEISECTQSEKNVTCIFFLKHCSPGS